MMEERSGIIASYSYKVVISAEENLNFFAEMDDNLQWKASAFQASACDMSGPMKKYQISCAK